MKIWFDTEFYEDGRTIELISIGMVREDGQTLYRETEGAKHLAIQSDWLAENVRPHLRGGNAVVFAHDLRVDLLQFAGPKPEFWAYYADYDWVALCQIFGRMIDLPNGWPMYCRDVKQLCDEVGNPKLPEQKTEHDALADAVWAKNAWDFLMRHDIANKLERGLSLSSPVL
jgi:hypothetical protein